MPLKNPTRPVAGVATWAVGATGAIAAATAAVVSALLAAVGSNAFTADAAFELVTVADDRVTVATASTTPTEVAGVDGAVVSDVVAASTAAECADFDSVLAGVDVGCSVSGAGDAGGVLACEGSAVSPEAAGSLEFGWVSTPLAGSSGSALVEFGAVDASDSVLPVCVPPLLLTVTPGATWVLEDVVPDVFVVPVAVAPVPVDVDPLVDVEPPPVVDVAADPVDDSPVDVELVELVEDDSVDVPVVSAAATP